ncbi:MAG: hypothetical protein WKF77_07400 [Planctomycetaceae bacterium]
MANLQRRIEKEAYWQGHVDGQAAGGLSVRAYCLDHWLSEPSYYAWRRKLQERQVRRTTQHGDTAEHVGGKPRHPSAGMASPKACRSRLAVDSGLIAVDVVVTNVSNPTMELQIQGKICDSPAGRCVGGDS